MQENATFDYEITGNETIEGEHLRHGRVPHDLFYFRGHFTDFPLVAGVCQLKWVRDLIADVRGAPSHAAKIVSAKFHAFLLPGDTFTIGVQEVNGAWRYRLYSANSKYASGKMSVR